MEIQNSNHEHPLVLKRNRDFRPFWRAKSLSCNAKCGRWINRDSLYYGCKNCDYRLHYSCAEPSFQHFNYLFHGHPLTLHDTFHSSRSCEVCLSQNACWEWYSCDTCDVNLHVECALKTPTITIESKKNVDGGKHLCHNKEMELVEIKHGKGEVNKDSCRICELPLSSSTTTTAHQAYSCRICKNFFHRSCIESLPEITHPFHSSHSLRVTFLIHDNTDGGKCGACCKTYPNRFFFFCGLCKIYICAGCIFSKEPPSVKYPGHDHLLHLIEKTPGDTGAIDCGASTYCKQMAAADELINLQRHLFRCIDCKFDLHFLGGPLPCSINHRSHIHPLVLFDWIVEDDFGEYYCDVCESLRDPRICVYYCAKCIYFAHVHCVISEVVRVLKEGPGDDNKLRILGQRKLVISPRQNDIVVEGVVDDQIIEDHEPTHKMALKDLIISLRQQELGKLESYEENGKALESDMSSVMRLIWERGQFWYKKRIIVRGTPGGGSEIQLQDQEFFFYTDYEMLVEKVKKCRETSWWTNLTLRELELKMVKVGGYMITWNLVPVMKRLLDKFRDSPCHPDEDELSWEMTSLVYFLLCRLLNSMSDTLVVDITESLLANWYSCLQFVEYKDFDVGFIKSRLEKLTHAYFEHQNDAKRKVREDIEKLEAKLEELGAKLKRHKELLQQFERAAGTKSELLEEYSKETSRFNWERAGDGLF